MPRAGIVGGVAVMLLLGACGEGASGRPEASEERQTETGGDVAREWVAVFETARDPNRLDAASAELQERVREALLVGPAGCHEGLPEALSVDGGIYVLGVLASSESELDRAVQRSGREPISRGAFRPLCPT